MWLLLAAPLSNSLPLCAHIYPIGTEVSWGVTSTDNFALSGYSDGDFTIDLYPNKTYEFSFLIEDCTAFIITLGDEVLEVCAESKVSHVSNQPVNCIVPQNQAGLTYIMYISTKITPIWSVEWIYREPKYPKTTTIILCTVLAALGLLLVGYCLKTRAHVKRACSQNSSGSEINFYGSTIKVPNTDIAQLDVEASYSGSSVEGFISPTMYRQPIGTHIFGD